MVGTCLRVDMSHGLNDTSARESDLLGVGGVGLAWSSEGVGGGHRDVLLGGYQRAGSSVPCAPSNEGVRARGNRRRTFRAASLAFGVRLYVSFQTERELGRTGSLDDRRPDGPGSPAAPSNRNRKRHFMQRHEVEESPSFRSGSRQVSLFMPRSGRSRRDQPPAFGKPRRTPLRLAFGRFAAGLTAGRLQRLSSVNTLAIP